MRAPALTLIDLLTGYRVTQALYVAARLAIADRLAEGPQGSEELARATGADAGALRRLLRALVTSFGVFALARIVPTATPLSVIEATRA